MRRHGNRSFRYLILLYTQNVVASFAGARRRQMFINVILAFMIVGSFLLAIVLHESGHALMASILGDPTPRSEGRQSLSLRTHLDALGTILCLILAFYPA